MVEDIIAAPIVWFDKGSEVGPRALGARSLIGDPRTQETKDQLNIIKQRQWWRPVAPIVLRDHIGEWFEQEFESPYMLHAFTVKEEMRDKVIAILHEDNTARLQSITENDGQDRLYEVIQCFYKKTGIPIVCNTSLNDKGEPIINRIEEALNFALRKGIKVAYFNGKRFELKNHETYPEKEPLRRPFRMQYWNSEEEWKELCKKYNPKNYSSKIIYTYTHTYMGKGVELTELDENLQKLAVAEIQDHLKRNPLLNKQLLLNRMIATNYIRNEK